MFVENELFCTLLKPIPCKYCPVSILLRYMRGAKLSPTSVLPLFSPSSKTKSGYVLRSLKLSRSLKTLGVLGCDPKVYA